MHPLSKFYEPSRKRRAKGKQLWFFLPFYFCSKLFQISYDIRDNNVWCIQQMYNSLSDVLCYLTRSNTNEDENVYESCLSHEGIYLGAWVYQFSHRVIVDIIGVKKTIVSGKQIQIRLISCRNGKRKNPNISKAI